MSGYYYPPNPNLEDEEDFDFEQAFGPSPSSSQQPQTYYSSGHPQQNLYHQPQQFYQPLPQYQPPMTLASHHPTAWATPTVPSNYPLQHDDIGSFPQYQETADFSQEFVPAGPSRRSTGYLSPEGADRTRTSRSTSFASNASSYSQSDASRSVSPSASEMLRWGRKNENGSWSCAYPGCNSRSTFNRGCDLRKHYKRHMKSLFCRHEGCPQATEGGFSSKKDRARHEARHNPSVPCEWEDCPRLFSRVDNMKDHVRRVHRRRAAE